MEADDGERLSERCHTSEKGTDHKPRKVKLTNHRQHGMMSINHKRAFAYMYVAYNPSPSLTKKRKHKSYKHTMSERFVEHLRRFVRMEVGGFYRQR